MVFRDGAYFIETAQERGRKPPLPTVLKRGAVEHEVIDPIQLQHRDMFAVAKRRFFFCRKCALCVQTPKARNPFTRQTAVRGDTSTASASAFPQYSQEQRVLNKPKAQVRPTTAERPLDDDAVENASNEQRTLPSAPVTPPRASKVESLLVSPRLPANESLRSDNEGFVGRRSPRKERKRPLVATTTKVYVRKRRPNDEKTEEVAVAEADAAEHQAVPREDTKRLPKTEKTKNTEKKKKSKAIATPTETADDPKANEDCGESVLKCPDGPVLLLIQTKRSRLDRMYSIGPVDDLAIVAVKAETSHAKRFVGTVARFDSWHALAR